MGQSEYVEIDPGSLRLPPSRSSGADPAKLIRQISRFGDSVDGMPPVWVYRGSDEELMIFDGVTRATRVAKLRPGLTITVEWWANSPTNLLTYQPFGKKCHEAQQPR